MAEFNGSVHGFGASGAYRSGSKKSGLLLQGTASDGSSITVRLALDPATKRPLFLVEHKTGPAGGLSREVLAAGFMDKLVGSALTAALSGTPATIPVAATVEPPSAEAGAAMAIEDAEEAPAEEDEGPAYAATPTPAPKRMIRGIHEVGMAVSASPLVNTAATSWCERHDILVGDIFRWRASKAVDIGGSFADNDTSIFLIADDSTRAPLFLLVRFDHGVMKVVRKYLDVERLVWAEPDPMPPLDPGTLSRWAAGEITYIFDGNGVLVNDEGISEVIRATSGQFHSASVDGARAYNLATQLHPGAHVIALHSDDPYYSAGDMGVVNTDKMVDFMTYSFRQKVYKDGIWSVSLVAQMKKLV